MEQHNKDVPATDFGNMASVVAPPKDSTNHVAEPIGWLEAPHGTFKRNHSVSVTFPPQTVEWKIPVFLGTPARAEEAGT